MLLPGLDGDGFLFAGLYEILSRQYACKQFSYPQHMHDYTDLCAWVCEQLDVETDYIIVGKSFGGPLGILVAETLGIEAKGLVLCATFCTPPLPQFILTLASLLYPSVIRKQWMAHFLNFFVCNGSNIAIAQKLQEVLITVPDKIIVKRMCNLRDLDMRPEASNLDIPCLILKAAHDRIVWFSRFGVLTKSTTKRIEGSHVIMATQASVVAEAIETFIKQLG